MKKDIATDVPPLPRIPIRTGQLIVGKQIFLKPIQAARMQRVPLGPPHDRRRREWFCARLSMHTDGRTIHNSD